MVLEKKYSGTRQAKATLPCLGEAIEICVLRKFLADAPRNSNVTEVSEVGLVFGLFIWLTGFWFWFCWWYCFLFCFYSCERIEL